MKKLLIAIASVAVLAVAWYLVSPLWRVVQLDEASPVDAQKMARMEAEMEKMKDEVVAKTQPMPKQATVEAQAPFVAHAHEVAGKALLIGQGKEKIVRFEDFETINGPNLHIYLSADLEGTDYVDLGKIRATKGSANYELPPGTDTGKYRHVLVWCVPFSVLFSAASL